MYCENIVNWSWVYNQEDSHTVIYSLFWDFVTPDNDVGIAATQSLVSKLSITCPVLKTLQIKVIPQ